MVWNKRMLTTEDVNSIIHYFCKGFVDYYVLDTRELTTIDTVFAYDFIDITRVTGNISFNVKNSLWSGGYKILDCDIESPTVTVSGNTINVEGNGLTFVILELELSSEFKHHSVFELDYEVKYTPVIRPFYETIDLNMFFVRRSIVNGEIIETPVSGLSVNDGITGDILTTGEDGRVTVHVSMDKSGDYYYMLQSINNNVLVDYYYKYKRVKCKIPVSFHDYSIIRDKNNILRFEFIFSYFDEMWNILHEDNIHLKVNNKIYDVVNYDFTGFYFNVPFGGADQYTMSIIIDGNDYLDSYIVDFTISTVYATFNTGSKLKEELESDNSASTVVFTGSVLDVPINITKDTHIIFDGVCSSDLDTVFNVTGGVVFTVDNIGFTGKNFININDGNVVLNDCNFNHCTDTVVKGKGDLNIDNSSFIDNNACININGNVNVQNSLFDLSDTDYLDTSLIPFMDVYGDLNFDSCQFSIDLHNITRLGYSYVMLRVGGNYTTNGVENNTLLKNGRFKMLKNTSEINVESEDYNITGKNNKAVTWNIINTNSVFYNQLNVTYIGD